MMPRMMPRMMPHMAATTPLVQRQGSGPLAVARKPPAWRRALQLEVVQRGAVTALPRHCHHSGMGAIMHWQCSAKERSEANEGYAC